MLHADGLAGEQRDTTIQLFVVFIHCGKRHERRNGKIVSVLNEVQYYATKTYEGAGLKLRSFITSALDWRKWLASRLGRVTLGEGTRPQSRSGRCGKDKYPLSLLGIVHLFLCCRGRSLVNILRAKRVEIVVIVKLFFFLSFSEGTCLLSPPPSLSTARVLLH